MDTKITIGGIYYATWNGRYNRVRVIAKRACGNYAVRPEHACKGSRCLAKLFPARQLRDVALHEAQVSECLRGDWHSRDSGQWRRP